MSSTDETGVMSAVTEYKEAYRAFQAVFEEAGTGVDLRLYRAHVGIVDAIHGELKRHAADIDALERRLDAALKCKLEVVARADGQPVAAPPWAEGGREACAKILRGVWAKHNGISAKVLVTTLDVEEADAARAFFAAELVAMAAERDAAKTCSEELEARIKMLSTALKATARDPSPGLLAALKTAEKERDGYRDAVQDLAKERDEAAKHYAEQVRQSRETITDLREEINGLTAERDHAREQLAETRAAIDRAVAENATLRERIESGAIDMAILLSDAANGRGEALATAREEGRKDGCKDGWRLALEGVLVLVRGWMTDSAIHANGGDSFHRGTRVGYSDVLNLCNNRIAEGPSAADAPAAPANNGSGASE